MWTLSKEYLKGLAYGKRFVAKRVKFSRQCCWRFKSSELWRWACSSRRFKESWCFHLHDQTVEEGLVCLDCWPWSCRHHDPSRTSRSRTHNHIREDLNHVFFFTLLSLFLIPHVSDRPTHPLQFRTEYWVKNASHIYFLLFECMYCNVMCGAAWHTVMIQGTSFDEWS